MQFEENHVLFGADLTPRIVSVELAGENEIHVYRRADATALTVAEKASFQPFLWMAGEQEGIQSDPLSGGLTFDRLVRCAGCRTSTGCARTCANAPASSTSR